MSTSSSISCFLIVVLFLLSTSTWCATMADNKPLQSPHRCVSQVDCQHTLSCLDHIQVPAYVSTLDSSSHSSKRPTATDHSVVSSISTAVKICKHLGGKKGEAICSYLLIDRSWRQWRQKFSQSLHEIKTRYIPIIYNSMVVNLNHPYIDALTMIQNKILDCWKLPSLEWYRLKSRMVALRDQYYYSYFNWFHNTKLVLNGMQLYTYSYKNDWSGLPYCNDYFTIDDNNICNNGDDNVCSNIGEHKGSNTGNNKGGNRSYYSDSYNTGIHNINELEPDDAGCFHDELGMTLCVDMDTPRVLDDTGLKDRVENIFEAMNYEQRSYVLRFQQRFIQWATKASSMTAEALDRAQSLWLQQAETSYRFLDNALNLDPHRNKIGSRHDDYDQEQASTTNEMNLCPPLVFPFSISPFATSLETSFFSHDSRPQFLRSAKPPSPPILSHLPLIPIQRPWTTCFSNQNENIGKSSKMYDNLGVPQKRTIRLRQQLLDPYNKIQHQYLLTRLQQDMMKILERLEKATLQEYFRIIDATHCLVFGQQYDSIQRQRLEHLHSHASGCARQHLYHELRLYISMSIRQRYRKSIQQLMDVTKQYNELVMKHVEQAYDEWEWTKEQQAQRLFTFYPLNVDTADTNDHDDEPEPILSSSYKDDSVTNSRAIMFIGQRADWAVEAHRKTVLRRWKAIFEDMGRHSHSIWMSAMDEAQGRHRVWIDGNISGLAIIVFMTVKLVILAIFLFYF